MEMLSDMVGGAVVASQMRRCRGGKVDRDQEGDHDDGRAGRGGGGTQECVEIMPGRGAGDVRGGTYRRVDGGRGREGGGGHQRLLESERQQGESVVRGRRQEERERGGRAGDLKGVEISRRLWNLIYIVHEWGYLYKY